MRYKQPMRVRFGDTDPARIAYYPRYFEWFHDAMEDFFEAAFRMSYADVLDTFGVGYPAVQAACEWHAPARFGDMAEMEVFLSRLTERSATFEYRLWKKNQLLATATVKTVGMDMIKHGPRPFPPQVLSTLRQFVEEDEHRPRVERLHG